MGAGAPVVRGVDPDSFAHGVLARRHPELIRRVLAAFPYGPDRGRELAVLLEEVRTGTVGRLPESEPAAEREQWERWGAGEYAGRSWSEVPFLWAESWFYRRLLLATGWSAPGPWRAVDPFGPFKDAELAGPAVDAALAELDRLAGLAAPDRLRALLHAALWGNRADLGFRAGVEADGGRGPGAEGPTGNGGADDGGLLADDTAAAAGLLAGESGDAAPRRIAVLADNAGPELLPDLVLIDHLLTTGAAASVALHLKPHPYFVSDATAADLLAALRRLRAAPADSEAARIGGRLWQAMTGGALEVSAHPFHCAPLPFAAMPDDLRAELAGCDAVVVKGDLNYRRLVGDRHWAPTTPFAELTAHFPTRVVALRTVKCEVAAGLSPAAVARAEADGGPEWRTGGRFAVVQTAPGARG